MLNVQRVLLVSTLLVMCILHLCQSVSVSQAEWDAYKKAFKKNYTNAGTTEAYARSYYAYNMALINAHNRLASRGTHKYTLRANQFSDKRLIHFNALFPRNIPPTTNNARPLPPAPTYPTPIVFDLRKLVNISVEDQGTACNSAWAYATAKAIEALQDLRIGDIFSASYSAQNLIDCAGSGKGCTNQSPQAALDYLAVHGMPLYLESQYRNNNASAEPGMCLTSGTMVTYLDAYAKIEDKDDETLKTYVANGMPAIIEFNPTSFEFMHYDKGIFTPPRSNVGSHYMVVLGYDTEGSNDYWIVQNSFGRTWGEDGIIRIARKPTIPLAKSTYLPIEVA